MNHKLAAEAYILRTIGELDAATEKKIMDRLKASPYGSPDEFFVAFESEESITDELTEWIKTCTTISAAAKA